MPELKARLRGDIYLLRRHPSRARLAPELETEPPSQESQPPNSHQYHPAGRPARRRSGKAPAGKTAPGGSVARRAAPADAGARCPGRTIGIPHKRRRKNAEGARGRQTRQPRSRARRFRADPGRVWIEAVGPVRAGRDERQRGAGALFGPPLSPPARLFSGARGFGSCATRARRRAADATDSEDDVPKPSCKRADLFSGTRVVEMRGLPASGRNGSLRRAGVLRFCVRSRGAGRSLPPATPGCRKRRAGRGPGGSGPRSSD